VKHLLNPYSTKKTLKGNEMKWLKELFFYDAESFTWSQFLLDACLAGTLLFLMVVGMWLAYAIFG